MDYYSYKPLVTLERPLVLTGVPGTDLQGIARMVGSFTGVPVLMVDRKLAHVLEHHPDRMTVEGRHSERWDLEKRLLAAAFAGSTAHVVSLSSHSLLRMGALGWLGDMAEVVYVREDVETVIRRVVHDVARSPNKHWLLTRGDTLQPESVKRHLEAHDVVLSRCSRVVEATRTESHAIAREIIEAVGLEG